MMKREMEVSFAHSDKSIQQREHYIDDDAAELSRFLPGNRIYKNIFIPFCMYFHSKVLVEFP